MFQGYVGKFLDRSIMPNLNEHPYVHVMLVVFFLLYYDRVENDPPSNINF